MMKHIWECDKSIQECLDPQIPHENLIRLSTKRYFESIDLFYLEEENRFVTADGFYSKKQR